AGANVERWRRTAAGRDSGRRGSRGADAFARYARLENRRLGRLPRGHQGEHAARPGKDGMAARRTRENHVSDELSSRPPDTPALFDEGDSKGFQTDLAWGFQKRTVANCPFGG